MKVEKLDLESLVSEQIPNYKEFPKDRKYRVKCPHCPEGKSPAMSVLRDFHAGICFRCEKLFVNDDTFSELQPSTSSMVSVFEELLSNANKDTLKFVNSTILSLYEETKGNDFLKTRNPFVEDWSYYGIREGDHEVITPYYMFGELVYYQIRRYDPRGFYNPKNVNAPLYIPSNVKESPGLWYPDVPTVLVEGPFDAIAYDCVRRYSKRKFNIAALGGKVITAFRTRLLKDLGVSRLTVNLDESELSQELKESMAYEFGRRNINIVPSYGPDPEEVLRKVGLQAFSDWVIQYIFYDQTFRDKQYYSYSMNNDLTSESFSINFNKWN